RKPIRPNYNRAILPLSSVQQRTELLQCDFLVPKVDRRHCTTGNADNLLVHLRTEGEAGKRQRQRNAWLQEKVRAQQEKKYEQESDIDEREQDQPAEVVFLRPDQLHSRFSGYAVESA